MGEALRSVFRARILGDRLLQERHPITDALRVDPVVLLEDCMGVADSVAMREQPSNFGSMFFGQPHPTFSTFVVAVLQLAAKTHTPPR